MIILSSLLFVSIIVNAYFVYRAYKLAGDLADVQEYVEQLELTNEYMYERIVNSYDTMQNIDRLGAFEKDDEAGTTFDMLKQVITDLKTDFDEEDTQEK
jgi:hypothetical protein